MIRRVFLVVCIVASAVTAHAQLVTPQLSKPASEPVEGDPLHDKYEAAWFRYEKAIGEIEAKVHAAFDAQFDEAADAGNLDLADMWDKKKKAFADTGAISWPSDGKAKVGWRKKHPTTDFPDEFTEVISAAVAGIEKAVVTLKEDYESLVKDYTKDRNLARAKALRDELSKLARKPAERPTMAEMDEAKEAIHPTSGDKKPVPKETFPRNGPELQRFLIGTSWENQTGFTFEWDSRGEVWHCRAGKRTPIKIAYTAGNKCAVEYINKAKQVIVFNESFTGFDQFNLEGKFNQSAVRKR